MFGTILASSIGARKLLMVGFTRAMDLFVSAGGLGKPKSESCILLVVFDDFDEVGASELSVQILCRYTVPRSV